MGSVWSVVAPCIPYIIAAVVIVGVVYYIFGPTKTTNQQPVIRVNGD
jgi:hypothetical protein